MKKAHVFGIIIACSVLIMGSSSLAADSPKINSQGRLVADGVIFDASDFTLLEAAYEEGKVLSYNAGFNEAVEEVKARPEDYGIASAGTEFVGLTYISQITYYKDTKINLSTNENIISNNVVQKNGTITFYENHAMAYCGYMIYWLNGVQNKSYNGFVSNRQISFHVNAGDAVEFGYYSGGISEGTNDGTLVIWFDAD